MLIRIFFLTRQALAVTLLDLSTAANSGRVGRQASQTILLNLTGLLFYLYYSSRNKSLNEARSIPTGKKLVIAEISRDVSLLPPFTPPFSITQCI